MAKVTKDSKADPVEALHVEADALTNLQSIDISRAAAGASFRAGYGAGPVTLQNAVPFIDMNPLLSSGSVDASDVADAVQTLITNFSRVRLIRYVRSGDNHTYQRFGYVVSPDSSTTEQTIAGAGFPFPPADIIDQSNYADFVAQARSVMQGNFNTLFAIVPYCHVQCHTDNPPPPPPVCHTDQIFVPSDWEDNSDCSD